MIQHHPIFSKFVPYSGPVESGFTIDFLGIKTRLEFLSGTIAPPPAVQMNYPPVDEEYFEWIDVLESVVSAGKAYTMIELGAGYGRWSVRAARAMASFKSLPFHLAAVEAEPRHFCWLQQHFRDNNIEPSEHTLLQAVVTDRPGDVLFYVGMPEGGKDKADEWYGQAITKSYEVVDRKQENHYEGFDVISLKSGWKSIRVKALPLLDLLRPLDRVDLIDLDVQGEEFKVIASSIGELDHKVARLHIGTHQHDIEDGLRDLLSRHDWHCLADYKCLSINDTPWGRVSFLDGVQSWTNPKLA